MSGYPVPRPGASPQEIHTGFGLLFGGKVNSSGAITLTANATTTALINPYVGFESVIPLMPTTANAAAAVATTYVSARTSGQATLTHANNAQTDRTFGFVILG